MKFRYKVLITNMILLSLGLGLSGYLMIRKNFELAQDVQMQNAIAENNLVQSMVEYELLAYLNETSFGVEQELDKIGELVSGSMQQSNSSFYIKYEDAYVYSSDGAEKFIRESLFSNLDEGGKNFIVNKEGEAYYIYVTSYSMVNEKPLCIVCKRDISEAYVLMDTQIAYYRILMAVILSAASAIMYVISLYLTRPLENLTCITSQIAAGNYNTRIEEGGSDEIGILAEKFNQMAAAIAGHIEELNDTVRRREQFVADFTHEMKTPMTTIIGYADTMRSMELPREEELLALNYIFSEGKRLELMSQKLFELIYLNRHDIEKNPIHIADMGNEIAKIAAPALEKKQIAFVMELEPVKIYGSRELLVTVFINLIDNARKASQQGSSIFFSGKRALFLKNQEETYCYEISVRDYGIGMTEEDAARICDEFYMADKSRSRSEGGAGLGMSLAALIIKRHGAELFIESKLSEGTTIRVVFPKAVCEEEDGV